LRNCGEMVHLVGIGLPIGKLTMAFVVGLRVLSHVLYYCRAYL